jgi:hypothetical protein
MEGQLARSLYRMLLRRAQALDVHLPQQAVLKTCLQRYVHGAHYEALTAPQLVRANFKHDARLRGADAELAFDRAFAALRLLERRLHIEPLQAWSKSTTHHITVEVNTASEHHNSWHYQVMITNNSDKPWKLKSRHWRIFGSCNYTSEVKGEGVVGAQPE